MMRNNLDPDGAEKPEELVVYGGIGRAARNWQCFDQIQTALTGLKADETLLVQSGKAVGVFRTHEDAPRVLLANRSEEHTSELQSLMRISYAVFCLKKNKTYIITSTLT